MSPTPTIGGIVNVSDKQCVAVLVYAPDLEKYSLLKTSVISRRKYFNFIQGMQLTFIKLYARLCTSDEQPS